MTARNSVSASAPARIDLAGGTLDIWPLNLMFDHPVTVNMAISLRAHATVSFRRGRKVVLSSEDQDECVTFSSMKSIRHDHPLGLLSRLAEHFVTGARGVDIVTRSEAPVGAGLAGSSALNIALCAALNRLTGRGLDKRRIIETAKDIEAALLGVPTGMQDYGAAVHGSVHAFSFPPGGMTKEKLDGAAAILEKRVLLFYSGASRSSGVNNWEMFRRVIEKDRRAMRLFEIISRCAAQAAEALRKKDMKRFDEAVVNEWFARGKLFPGISTNVIDKAITAGIQNGASGARICGAGGGGCFILLADEDKRDRVAAAVERIGCQRLPFSLSKAGLKIYNAS